MGTQSLIPLLGQLSLRCCEFSPQLLDWIKRCRVFGLRRTLLGCHRRRIMLVMRFGRVFGVCHLLLQKMREYDRNWGLTLQFKG
jgi:hypothetical protein